MRAFSTKLKPVSSASDTPKRDCGSTAMSSPASSSLISRTLPALPVASTMRFMWRLRRPSLERTVTLADVPHRARRARASIDRIPFHARRVLRVLRGQRLAPPCRAQSPRQRGALLGDELADAALREFEHGLQFFHAEGVALGRALHLDEGAGLVHYHVHVGFGVGIFGVIEVEHRHTLVDADRHRRHLAVNGVFIDDAALLHVAHGVNQRDVAARDGRGAGAAVGLEDVAIDGDGALAQRRRIHHGPQRAADQALDFHGAAALLALRGLALGALAGGARQHAVFGGDPAAAVAFDPARHAVFDAGGAQHPSVAEFDEHRSFGVFGVVTGKFDDTKIAGLSAAGTHWNSFNVLPGRSGIIACLPHGRAIARAVSQSGGTEYYGGQ